MKLFDPIKLKWKKLPTAWGYAIPEKRTIIIDPRLDDKTMMDIIIHEATHCDFPFLDEQPVNAHGLATADLLTRAGFKRSHEGDE